MSATLKQGMLSIMPYYIIYSRIAEYQKVMSHIRKHLRNEHVKLEFAVMKKEMINIHKGSRTTKVYNALPGYLFLRTDEPLDSKTVHEILETWEVYYFLHYADGTLELQRNDEKFASQVFELPKVITADNVFIRNGDTVEIVNGAFSTLTGKILKIDRRRCRVDVLLKFMERDLKLSLPFSSVAVRDQEDSEDDKKEK